MLVVVAKIKRSECEPENQGIAVTATIAVNKITNMSLPYLILNTILKLG